MSWYRAKKTFQDFLIGLARDGGSSFAAMPAGRISMIDNDG